MEWPVACSELFDEYPVEELVDDGDIHVLPTVADAIQSEQKRRMPKKEMRRGEQICGRVMQMCQSCPMSAFSPFFCYVFISSLFPALLAAASGHLAPGVRSLPLPFCL